MNLEDILSENSRRLQRFSAPFDPISGQGSVGPRVRVDIPDFPIPVQFLPEDMLAVPLLQQVMKAGSIAAFIASLPSDQSAMLSPKSVTRTLIRLRYKYDFPFWAASLVRIKNKEAGDDVLFRLRYPQRLLVSRFEEKRRAGLPIRLILLKARQWGGSTTTQLYMAWLQFFHESGLNSLIIAHQGSASDEIKDMFDRMFRAYPSEFLSEDPLLPPKTKAAPGASLSLERVGLSGSTSRIPRRNCKIKIGTAERPDGCRGGDYSLVHLSEVGIWKKTEGKSPEDIVRSACSGILLKPLTMIVMESTANGTGNFFHREYLAAASPDVPSQFEALFIPWFFIEQYSLPFSSDTELRGFAAALLDGRLRPEAPSPREESGRYLWWLWEQGASLEAIHWYVRERSGRNDHAVMASEFPSDDEEAFVHSGSMVFDKYQVRLLQSSCKPPRFIGEVYGDAPDGPDALSALRFRKDSQGLLHVWELPDSVSPDPADSALFIPRPDAFSDVADRYLVVVDVGGRSSKADFSVILVLDRVDMIEGHPPAVVAQWYGHCDIDRLAWNAARIAAFYDNALLVIESNTVETRDRERHIEGGDQSLFIFNQLASVYDNLYARPQSDEDIRQGLPRKYGFHTNVSTKPMIISSLVKAVRDRLWIERDARCLDELRVYERKPNGAYGAIVGHHDDLLMTRAIGLHICFYDMPRPSLITPRSPRKKTDGPVSEAAF